MINQCMHADGDWGLATLAFKVQALQFDLNRELKYISMKDQIIRGRTLILGAHHAKLIGKRVMQESGQSNVMIVGGGIGGISAALTACQLGFKATVLEATPACFSLLGYGSDRLFSATVYDWPHNHASNHAFPFLASLRDPQTLAQSGASSVLRFPAAPVTAGVLRNDLLKQLGGYQRHYGAQLDVRTENRLNRLTDVTINENQGSVITAHLDSKSLKQHHESEIVIFALGFGLDKSNEQTQAGREFFSYRGLQADLTKALAGNGLVRIIGAGDGGLQEALRFVLANPHHDLHYCVSQLARAMAHDGHSTAWAELLSQLQSAEEHAAKSLMWGYTEDIVFAELDVIYRALIGALVATYPTTVNMWANAALRNVPLTVELVDNSSFSKRVYALNRFLTLLIGQIPNIKGHAKLRRVATGITSGSAAVSLTRKGFAAQDAAWETGTANKEDLLRRIAFRAIPMNLDTVI